MKERRGEGRRGQKGEERRQRCDPAQRLDLKKKECVCAETCRVQNRCDQQVFTPQELAIGGPGVAVRVEPAEV